MTRTDCIVIVPRMFRVVAGGRLVLVIWVIWLLVLGSTQNSLAFRSRIIANFAILW